MPGRRSGQERVHLCLTVTGLGPAGLPVLASVFFFKEKGLALGHNLPGSTDLLREAELIESRCVALGVFNYPKLLCSKEDELSWRIMKRF
ncbi:hypothetical protein NDU88_005204 [Pleurodeles waltl]|uniref:Uncharacterized protein n=1 Tax=Pleurodeles waltl TaxID=8319 RepID=A0AAV7VIC2_PLEWA|nr:hypothetical protein NDU88_005204 [Pleurodeles waltl]